MIRDEGDRLEPICLQSLSAVQLCAWALRYRRGERDEFRRFEAAHVFISSLLSRVFYHP